MTAPADTLRAALEHVRELFEKAPFLRTAAGSLPGGHPVTWADLAALSAQPAEPAGRETIAEIIAAVVQREGVTHSSVRKAADAILALGATVTPQGGGTERPFYGAECPSYPNCAGGCGLGCTKEIERVGNPASGDRAAVIEWQPIETAPKDGTRIIGGFWSIRWADSHRKGDVVACWYQPEFDAFISSCREMCMHNGYTFEDGSTRQLHSPTVEPVTHWMPLPDCTLPRADRSTVSPSAPGASAPAQPLPEQSPSGPRLPGGRP